MRLQIGECIRRTITVEVEHLTSSRDIAVSRKRERHLAEVGIGALSVDAWERSLAHGRSIAWIAPATVARLTFGNRTTSSGNMPFDAPGFAAPPRDGCAST